MNLTLFNIITSRWTKVYFRLFTIQWVFSSYLEIVLIFLNCKQFMANVPKQLWSEIHILICSIIVLSCISQNNKIHSLLTFHELRIEIARRKQKTHHPEYSRNNCVLNFPPHAQQWMTQWPVTCKFVNDITQQWKINSWKVQERE